MVAKRQTKTTTKTKTKEAEPEAKPLTEDELLEKVLAATEREMAVVSKAMNETGRPMAVNELVAQRRIIEEILKAVMKEGVHYGKIPGTGDKSKPTLWQAGAQMLCNVFRLVAILNHEKEYVGTGISRHMIVTSRCELNRLGTDTLVGVGEGMSTTLASKYRYRTGQRKCPECQQEAIIKSQFDPGWYCFPKKGGCGAKFAAGEASIEDQSTGKVEHDNPADFYNTTVKMSNKSALVAATLNATGAGDLFSQEFNQDAEDGHGDGIDHAPAKPATQQPSSAAPQQQPKPATQPANGQPAKQKTQPAAKTEPTVDEAELITSWLQDLEKCKTIDELKAAWMKIQPKTGDVVSKAERNRLERGKQALKEKLEAKPSTADPGQAVAHAIQQMDTPQTAEALDELWNGELKTLRDQLKGGPFETPLANAYRDRIKLLTGKATLPW